MVKRTTIEIDEDLLARAKQALSLQTTRDTVEESLRRVVERHDVEQSLAKKRQSAFLSRLPDLVDLEVLSSGEMWR